MRGRRTEGGERESSKIDLFFIILTHIRFNAREGLCMSMEPRFEA